MYAVEERCIWLTFVGTKWDRSKAPRGKTPNADNSITPLSIPTISMFSLCFNRSIRANQL